jgi:hypothetical protein
LSIDFEALVHCNMVYELIMDNGLDLHLIAMQALNYWVVFRDHARLHMAENMVTECG